MVLHKLHVLPAVTWMRGASSWLDDNLLISFGTGLLLQTAAAVADLAGCFAKTPQQSSCAFRGQVLCFAVLPHQAMSQPEAVKARLFGRC